MAEGPTTAAAAATSLRNSSSPEIYTCREKSTKMMETSSTITTRDQTRTQTRSTPATAASVTGGSGATTTGFCMKILSGKKGCKEEGSRNVNLSGGGTTAQRGVKPHNSNSSSKGGATTTSESSSSADSENNNNNNNNNKCVVVAGCENSTSSNDNNNNNNRVMSTKNNSSFRRAGPEREESSRTATTARLNANDDTTTDHLDNREEEEIHVVEVVYNNNNNNNNKAVEGVVTEEDEDDDEENAAVVCVDDLGKENGGSAAGTAAAGDAGSDDDIIQKKNEDLEVESSSSSSSKKKQQKKEQQEQRVSIPRAAFDKVNNVRLFCGRVVNHEHVQLGIIILIIINALMMGLATFDFVSESETISHIFEVMDETFLIIFTVESGMQLLYHGWHLFQDAWLVFDLSIVCLSWSLHALQVVRAFRVFRAFRLVTRLTVLKNLIQAIFAVAPSMGSITALLLLIMYVFAVLCTELFGTLYDEGVTDIDYFSQLHTSLFTLFQMMTLEDWAAIVRQIMVVNYWAWLLFSVYLVCTGFILYSLVIAVVCDAVAVTENDSKAEFKNAQKLETSQRVIVLQQRMQQLASQQHAAMTAIQQALHELQAEKNDNSSSSNGIRNINSNCKARDMLALIHAMSSSPSLPSLHSAGDRHDDDNSDYDNNNIDDDDDAQGNRGLMNNADDDAVLSMVLETSVVDDEAASFPSNPRT